MKFIDLPPEQRAQILTRLETRLGLKPAIIEKDWWVTAVLRAIFELPYAEHLSFKGGTSLSKCWHLIDRMSEDIDIGITREYLGFDGPLSKTQISDKLRRAACSFVRKQMQYDLNAQLIKNGISSDLFRVWVDITPVSTTDPEVIWVEYNSAVENVGYIPNVVKIEVSGRSMSEPIADIAIEALIDTALPHAPFCEQRFNVRAVLAKRTFLEKLFLLHEEISKNDNLIRVNRMTRHLYDVHKILSTAIANEALSDEKLYETVIAHRRTFIGLRGFDYSTLSKKTLRIIPPKNILVIWKKDYEAMQENMIYGDSVPFEELIDDLRKFNDQINNL